VRIQNAGLKCAARDSLTIQDAKISPKIRHLWAPSHKLSGCIFATKACIDRRKKNLLKINISSSCPYFGPLAAEIGSLDWGTPANFNGFRVLPSLLQRRRSPEANQTLHDVWPFPGLVHYVYTFSGAISPWRNFARCEIHFGSKFCVLLLAAYSTAARHSSSGRQPNFAARYKEWNYGTFADGATYIRL